MERDKELLFSVTAADCEWKYTKGTGCGGQKRNKTSSAVHCMHRPSGAHGYSEASRSQAANKIDAFTKMAHSKEFREWHRLEVARRTGELAEVARRTEASLRQVKVEVRQAGRWVEVDKDLDLPAEETS